MSARERAVEEVSVGEESPGDYLVEVRVKWAPGKRGEALKALAHVCLEALVHARGRTE